VLPEGTVPLNVNRTHSVGCGSFVKHWISNYKYNAQGYLKLFIVIQHTYNHAMLFSTDESNCVFEGIPRLGIMKNKLLVSENDVSNRYHDNYVTADQRMRFLGWLICQPPFQIYWAATQKSPIKHQKMLPTNTAKEIILATGGAFIFSCMICNLTFQFTMSG